MKTFLLKKPDDLIRDEKKKLAQLLSLAILLPSPENVEVYMREQRNG